MVPFLHRAMPSTLEENPLWLIVLADMMTNLMLFFLVMYALTQQGPKARIEMARTFNAAEVVERNPRPGEAPPVEFREDAAAKIHRTLSEADVAAQAQVELAENGVRVRLREELLFAVGEAALSPRSAKTLAALAGVLKQMPNEVIVEGHTDDIPMRGGLYRDNRELSVARSYSVLSALLEQGVEAKRLITSGYAELHPAAPNDTPEGRAENRRVEIVILRGENEAAERGMTRRNVTEPSREGMPPPDVVGERPASQRRKESTQ